MNDIHPEELKQRIKKGEKLTLIDVRESWEFEEVNIGAKPFPLYDLPQQLEKLNFLKETEIIVHCQSGKRSGQAKKFLQQHGFMKVRSLHGGLNTYLQD